MGHGIPQTGPKYEPLSSTSSVSELDDEGTSFLAESRFTRVNLRKHHGLTILVASVLNAILFTASCLLFGTWYYNTHIKLNAELRRTSTYSPLHDLLDLELGPKKINGTLYPPKDSPSIARQMPNPEADAIWEEYELVRIFPVTSEQIRAMGKDPSTVAKLEDEEWGLGDDAYVAFLDVFHHLHCLNTLRKLAYSDYYGNELRKKSGEKPHEEMHSIHINHCVDILMQTIMCSGHVSLATMHWVADHPYPFPDMSVNRQCINFDKLADWREENTIDMDKYDKIMDKKGKGDRIKELPAPDMFYKYYRPNWTNPNHANGANPGEDFNL